MKKISIVIPTYNEEKNVRLISEEIKKVLQESCGSYDYEIIFIDNFSNDKTRDELVLLCHSDKHIKAIFNARNFGQFNSPYYGLTQSTGDCTILIVADFQDPVEMIKDFVREWENGYKIVIGIKVKSKENGIIYFFRSVYYALIKKMSQVEQIQHFTGFGLYDKEFIKVLQGLEDPTPYLRGIVAELGFARKELKYTQQKRRHGKSSNNFFKLYDAAMVGFTSYTKVGLRMATFIGFFFSIVSMLITLVYIGLKLLYWNEFNAGITPIIVGIFFFSSLQLIFLGVLGEYVLSINQRVMKRPLVIEEKRINF
ncbi:MAG: glycosyltransferase family 2 protein [Erysipelotrichaceae bacterium]|nr:glycosyltransferase family 2 protein [Erysipelotrichaceae bacterium]